MSRKPTPNIDYTSRDYEAYRSLMLQKLTEKMPEYTDTTESDAGIVILEALANGLDIVSLYADVVANDVLLPTTQSRRLAVLISRCLGYTPSNQTASEYQQVFVLSGVQENDIIIPKGTRVKTMDDNDLETLYFETMSDLLIPAGAKGDEKDNQGHYIYTVKVKAGETINQDVIGTSSGAPMQSFVCNYSHVLVDSLELFVDEGLGDELWTRVDSFIDCDENSKVYMVLVDNFDQCLVQFGNGIKGKIPLTFPNGIVANYRVGGGTSSNVAAGAINTMDTGIAFVENTFNLDIDIYGRDKESLESIKINAPASYRVRDRLVTLGDYEDLLKIAFYEFLEIMAVRDKDNKKHVHLFYYMREGYTFTDALAEKLMEFISERSMVGTTYDIEAYSPQVVDIQARVYTDMDYDSDIIVDNIKEYLAHTVFNPENLSFGDSITKSIVEEGVRTSISGVHSFRILSPLADIISPLNERNILALGKVEIVVIEE